MQERQEAKIEAGLPGSGGMAQALAGAGVGASEIMLPGRDMEKSRTASGVLGVAAATPVEATDLGVAVVRATRAEDVFAATGAGSA